MLTLLGVVMVFVHLALSRPEFSMPVRALLAVPIVPLLLEVRRFLKNPTDDSLPLNAFGLLVYYIYFSAAALSAVPFKDMRGGMVHFTDESRLLGAAGVALGSLALAGGMAAGERFGRRSTFFQRIVPPRPPTDAYGTVVIGYAFVAFVAVLLPKPPSLALFISVCLSPFLAIGLVAGNLQAFRGNVGRNLTIAAMFVGVAQVGLVGMLEPLFRYGLVVICVRWRFLKQLPLRMVVGCIAVFFLLQPVKSQYRRETWNRTDVTASEKMEAWGRAISSFWIESRSVDTDKVASASDRLTELDAVNHAFMLVPDVVPYDDGRDWVQIPARWIPRALWPDKPETGSFEGRYAVVFRRQSARSNKSTAITLPIVVDGYWNFGWIGVVLACGTVGLWNGFIQGAFRGSWALIGFAVLQLAGLNTSTALQVTVSSIPQALIGWLITVWSLHFACRLISRSRAGVPRPFGGSRALTPAAQVTRTAR